VLSRVLWLSIFFFLSFFFCKSIRLIIHHLLSQLISSDLSMSKDIRDISREKDEGERERNRGESWRLFIVLLKNREKEKPARAALDDLDRDLDRSPNWNDTF
jgi:hypothetical protein